MGTKSVVTKNSRADLAFELEKDIKLCKANVGRGIWIIAKSLKDIQDKQLYTELGYQNLSEWVSSPDIDLSPRWAYAFIDMYEVYFEQLKISKTNTDFLSTSYTKLHQILPIIKQDPSKAKEWIDKAINLRRIDLHREIAQHRLTESIATGKRVAQLPALVELRHANPLQEMRKLGTDTVNAVITVPIHLNKRDMQLMVTSTANVPDTVIYHQGRVQHHEAWVKEAYRMLKLSGSILAVVDERSLPSVMQAMKQAGFYLVRDIIWLHGAQTPLVGTLTKNHHTILWGVKGDAFFTGLTDIKSDVWNMDFKSLHEIEGDIPPQVAAELMNLVTKPGDLIVDPFASAGTIVVSASKMGRRAIGIEADAEAYEIAHKQVDAIKPKVKVSIA